MDLTNLYNLFKSCNGVATDTRQLKKNGMFFALNGERFNGNNFVSQAFENGAKYCIVDEKKALINEQCILVENSLKTLQKLSNFHRKTINISIIALTGSNGKTTTKELITNVISTTFKTKSTKGNFNNHIGVPLTLLEFDENLDFGIVEMGANHQKEIKFLCEIAEPNFGLITNFGKAHLEGFGGVEGVIKGKSEIYDYLNANNKIAFINTDDYKQVKQINNYKNIFTFGKNTTNDCVISFIDANPFVKLNFEDLTISSQLIGEYNFGNIAIAIAIAKYFKIEPLLIKKAIEGYIPKNNRSEIKKINSNTIYLDAYNANPSSMMAGLKNFLNIKSNDKVIIIGDMLELGSESEKEHQKIINYIEEHFSFKIITLGKNFYKTNSKKTTKKYLSYKDMTNEVDFKNMKNKSIFIKGSRGMTLERIIEEF